MKLSSDLIPHEDFHKGFWLKTPKCSWYFFYEHPRDYQIPKNTNFYNTLDEELVDLVKYLHEKNMPTTPSCAGHIFPENRYDKIYSELKNIKNDICDNGILLKNPETDRKFFYKNPRYSLPFSRQEFIHEMNEYQKKGVLGFVDNKNIYENIKDLVPSQNIDGITLLFSIGKSKNNIKNNWKSIENLIKHVSRVKNRR